MDILLSNNNPIGYNEKSLPANTGRLFIFSENYIAYSSLTQILRKLSGSLLSP